MIVVGLFMPDYLFAQTTLQVVTKKVEKIFPFAVDGSVMIEGEKAEIKVETWSRKEVKVILELSSKNPEKQAAERDLAYFQYDFQSKNGQIRLRNFSTEGSKVQSNFTARYEIWVPEDCPVEMSNYFGKSVVRNLSNRVAIRSEFSPVALSNVKGLIDVNTRFGDLVGEWLNGIVKVQSHRSNVTLRNIKGTYDIQSKYGLIKIFADPDLIDLNIEADKGDVYLFNPDPKAFGYELIAHFGSITVPDDLKLQFTENTEKMRHAIFTASQNQQATVMVRINYGDIVIRDSRP